VKVQLASLPACSSVTRITKNEHRKSNHCRCEIFNVLYHETIPDIIFSAFQIKYMINIRFITTFLCDTMVHLSLRATNLEMTDKFNLLRKV